MVGWPVIGLLDRLPWADHDGVSEVFSTEKREGVAASGCLALRHAPPVPSPVLDALNKKAYLSHTWAARRLTATACKTAFAPQISPLSPSLPCLIRCSALMLRGSLNNCPLRGLKRPMEGACPPWLFFAAPCILAFAVWVAASHDALGVNCGQSLALTGIHQPAAPNHCVWRQRIKPGWMISPRLKLGHMDWAAVVWGQPRTSHGLEKRADTLAGC